MTKKKSRCGAPAVSERNDLARLAMEVACDAYNVSIANLTSSSRCRAHVALARQTAMYLAHVVAQLSFSEIAVEFSRNRTTVSHACHLIEDRRDSPMFNMQINVMESILRDHISAARLRAAPRRSHGTSTWGRTLSGCGRGSRRLVR